MDMGRAQGVLIADVNDCGLRATLDPRDVNPPCVIVRELTMTPNVLNAWTVVWQLDLVAGDTGTVAAATVLSGMLERLTVSIPVDSATRVDLALPGVPDTLPAYRCTVTTTVSDD